MLVSPASKASVPEGSAPAAKSAPVAGTMEGPARPSTLQSTLPPAAVSPVRVTEKVKAVEAPVSPMPSGLAALVAAMA